MGGSTTKSPIKLNEGEQTEPVEHSLGSSIAHQKDIHYLYILGPVLNSGRFGTVRLGHLKGDPTHHVAIKTIDKKNDTTKLEHLRREIENLAASEHPNILKFYDAYEDTQYVHLVTEFCSGGELFDRIHTKGRFDEAEAAHVMKMIFSAVQHLHSLNIVHRDLKPENFMFLHPGEDSPLKLIDFGFSRKLDSGEQQPLTMLGTPSYISPELLTGTYGPETDLWSCGVILYTMLAGRYPFYDVDEQKIYQMVKRGEFSINGRVWSQVSIEAKHLVTRLLDKNPQQRLTATQALQHPWFAKTEGPVITLDRSLVDAYHSYQINSKIQRGSMLFLVNHFTLRDIRSLMTTFQEQDSDNSGSLYPEELRRVIQSLAPSGSHEELNLIFSNPQGAVEEKIQYMNFLAAAKSCKFQVLEQTLWETFKSYNPAEEGGITIEQAAEALLQLGVVSSEEEMGRQLRDMSEKDLISFEEFRLLLRRIA